MSRLNISSDKSEEQISTVKIWWEETRQHRQEDRKEQLQQKDAAKPRSGKPRTDHILNINGVISLSDPVSPRDVLSETIKRRKAEKAGGIQNMAELNSLFMDAAETKAAILGEGFLYKFLDEGIMKDDSFCIVW